MAAQLSLALILLLCTVRANAQAASDGTSPPPPSEPAPAATPAAPTPPAMAPVQPNPAAKSEASAPAPSPGGEAQDDISLEEWNRDDWMLVKPKVSLVDIDGYFRVRGDALNRLDFDNGSRWELGVGDQPAARYPDYADNHANFTNTNMRLRVEPRINITEQAQVIATVDVFDNLILGSTPDTLVPGMLYTPVNGLSRSQKPPRFGANALVDSIVVKRLWGRLTALNEQVELQIGRMPDHFGLGMLYNNGDCLDCDYGTVVDRLALSFRIYNHIFTPMVNWIARGPQFRPFGYFDPMPQNAAQWGDTMEYALRVVREDHPDDVADAVNHGKQVLNYGTSQAFRFQARDFPISVYSNNGPTGFDSKVPPPWPINTEQRQLFLYTGDIYAKYYEGHFELAAEAAVQAGSFTDNVVNARGNVVNAPSKSTSILMIGGAIEGKYHLRGDFKGVALALKLGGASGDSRAGFGALDAADTQRGGNDNALRNFQFSPDYHLDLLMFRRIIGTVTDAWYLRPEVSYRFDERILGRINAVYSQAMRASSTPSGGGPSPATPMGVEFDGELAYGLDTNLERGQFLASLLGGILFPLGAFNNWQLPAGQQAGSFAWAVLARLYYTF